MNETKDFISYAVDFDGTLSVNKHFPEIGDANVFLFDFLIDERKKGNKVILYTCRSGQLLDNAIAFCMERGLHFDAVNANLPENIAKYGGDTRKIHADYYIDDRTLYFPSVGLHFPQLRGRVKEMQSVCQGA